MGLLTMFCQQTPTPLNRPSRVVLICGREQSSNRLDAIFADRSSDCHQPHGLQGRLARSTAVRFFAVLSRARALRAITQSAPALPLRMPSVGFAMLFGSGVERQIMGLMAVAATVSKDRIQPVGRLFIGLISFRSAGWYSRSRVNSPSPTAISE